LGFAAASALNERVRDTEMADMASRLAVHSPTVATPSVVLEVDEKLPALEENGFNIIDVTPDTTTVRSFRFNGELDDPSSIDTLEPFREVVLERAAS
jgi:hypothetical protein